MTMHYTAAELKKLELGRSQREYLEAVRVYYQPAK